MGIIQKTIAKNNLRKNDQISILKIAVLYGSKENDTNFLKNVWNTEKFLHNEFLNI